MYKTIRLKVQLLVLLALGCLSLLIGSQGVGAVSTTNEKESIEAAPTLLIQSQTQGIEPTWRAVVRHRFVTINRSALEADRFSAALFDDYTPQIVKDSRRSLVEAIGPGAGPGFIWKGHIDRVPGSSVTVIVNPRAVTAMIQVPHSNHVYELMYAGNGENEVHVLYDVDRGLVQQSHGQGGSNQELPETPKNYAKPGGEALDCLDEPCTSIIDVLGVYTPRVYGQFGRNEDAIRNAWSMAIDWSNIAHYNSEINVRLQLAHIYKTPGYVETNINQDLNRIAYHDTYMEEVFQMQQLYHADLTQLAGFGYWAGKAQIGGEFSIVDAGSLADGYLPTHEWGHNEGCGHARNDPIAAGIRPWAWGYYRDGYFTDIMSQGCNGCVGTQNFSNPLVTWCCDAQGNHLPMGIAYDPTIPPSQDQSADCAATFKEYGPAIAARR